MKRYPTPSDEASHLAAFLQGLAAAAGMKGNSNLEEKLSRAADWLARVSHCVCGAGVIGCEGGPNCGSDHK